MDWSSAIFRGLLNVVYNQVFAFKNKFGLRLAHTVHVLSVDQAFCES